MAKRKFEVMVDTVLFYDAKGESGFLSNFYGRSESKQFMLNIGGSEYQTVEHFFQASKFTALPDNIPAMRYAEIIRNSSTPNIAKVLAGQKVGGGYPWRTKLNTVIAQYLAEGVVLRPDWEAVKDDVMYEAVKCKFLQNPRLADMLLATGDKHLIEHTKRDAYWGDAGDGSGKNKLGQILMKVREELST
jgi:ribA/ribD-fused uncharacterized protein